MATGPDVAGSSAARPGRPPSTSAAELERVGLDLFVVHGFDAVTVDDIAAATGISRRTFFRYFASKNDLVWGDFDTQLAGFTAALDERGALAPMDALREAVVAFNAVPDSELARHRTRMSLILGVPALQAHSTLRYAAWRDVVADFALARLGRRHGRDARLLGHLALAASVASYEQWLAEPGSDLGRILDAAFRRLADGFGRPRT